jgi:hypothetical protein
MYVALLCFCSNLQVSFVTSNWCFQVATCFTVIPVYLCQSRGVVYCSVLNVYKVVKRRNSSMLAALAMVSQHSSFVHLSGAIQQEIYHLFEEI